VNYTAFYSKTAQLKTIISPVFLCWRPPSWWPCKGRNT